MKKNKWLHNLDYEGKETPTKALANSDKLISEWANSRDDILEVKVYKNTDYNRLIKVETKNKQYVYRYIMRTYVQSKKVLNPEYKANDIFNPKYITEYGDNRYVTTFIKHTRPFTIKDKTEIYYLKERKN